jgi:hypothetical protein
MSKQLEEFIKNNREEFDKSDPGPVVWHNIQQQLKKPAGKSILISMRTIRWSAAAAIIILLGAGGWWMMAKQQRANAIDIVKTPDTPAVKNDAPAIAQQQTVKENNTDTPRGTITTAPERPSADAQLAQQNENEESQEELVHYTRLVELKQHQIKRMAKDEPMLYRQFAGDFNRLDSIFHMLKKQLPVNPNHEQILEAMIQNLQYQEALLNQQLNIIKKIKHTKKQAYEKAFRSI